MDTRHFGAEVVHVAKSILSALTGSGTESQCHHGDDQARGLIDCKLVLEVFSKLTRLSLNNENNFDCFVLQIVYSAFNPVHSKQVFKGILFDTWQGGKLGGLTWKLTW